MHKVNLNKQKLRYLQKLASRPLLRLVWRNLDHLLSKCYQISCQISLATSQNQRRTCPLSGKAKDLARIQDWEFQGGSTSPKN